MIEIKNSSSHEKVILAGLLVAGQDAALFEEDMQEMRKLLRTAGATVEESVVQRREGPEASTFLGRGKVMEIKEAMIAKDCHTLVIDAELSPGQVRTIESMIDGKVIDRGQLILDIFAAHARTNEARIQVELAQMRMLYPRLTHAWTHFSQQVGGIGTRGPGEKQLEVDRRTVQKKITDLRGRLKKIEKSRTTQRRSRRDTFNIALVGYTNVGKSSILNALCGSGVRVEDKLFATLDTATRRSYIPGAGTVMISDTVGFIRKLPLDLVASFRSTLEVVTEANLLIVVMDASSRWCEQELATVEKVITDLGAADIGRVMLFNKCDLVTDPFEHKRLALSYPQALFVSAFNRDDIRRVKECLAACVVEYRREKAVDEMVQRESKSLVPPAP
jgi:GTP-binding protein HflX